MRNNADYVKINFKKIIIEKKIFKTWSKYVFLLFHNRLCYILNSVENFNLFKDKFQSDDEFESVSTQDCFVCLIFYFNLYLFKNFFFNI